MGKVFVKTNIKTLRKRIVYIYVINVFKIVIRGNCSAMVSAARAPVTATFSIRFDSPPSLKSGRLYIIIFIIIRYKRYYCYWKGGGEARAACIPKPPFLNQSALHCRRGAVTFLSLDIQ